MSFRRCYSLSIRISLLYECKNAIDYEYYTVYSYLNWKLIICLWKFKLETFKKFALKVCLNFEVVCIDLKFGSNEFHERIVDGKNDLENVSKRHLGTLYCKEFLRL
jgi:hypothetical protein